MGSMVSRLLPRKVWRAQLLWLWSCFAPIVALLLWYGGPTRRAQARAFGFACALEAVVSRLPLRARSGAVPLRATIMNPLISQFCLLRPDFALDFEYVGGEALHELLAEGRGALIATVHTQMALSAHGGLRWGQGSPLFVGFGDGNLRRWSWGSSAMLANVPPDDPALFGRIAAALDNGRVVVVFVDHIAVDGRRTLISPNLFAWAELGNRRLLHMLATLNTAGQIRIELAAEPEGARGSGLRARAFVAFVEARWSRRFLVCRPKHAGLPLAQAEADPVSTATSLGNHTPQADALKRSTSVIPL